MNIKISNPRTIINRITEFYNNAKILKYANSYGWDEVRKDILMARSDTIFSPCGFSTPEWINAGYKVVRNSRNWAFAYKMDNDGNMVIYDAENCKNLTVKINQSNNLSIQNNLSSVRKCNKKPYQSIGYGWWAIRHDDGFIYIHHKSGNIMPNVRFNEILRQFRKRKDDRNIYAVGEYGGKSFKVYLNGKYVMLENRRHNTNVLRLTEFQFKQMLVECITKIIKEIA